MKTFPEGGSSDTASKRDRIRAKIREAFRCVSLGDGIGLLQAQAIDSRENEHVCQSLRSQDEKDDWQRIAPDNLNACFSSLSFFDPAGMRFHLPAFLIAELDGDYEFDLVPELIDLSDYKRRQFSGLTIQQRCAVGGFLRHIQNQPGHWLDVHKIDFALESFWDADPAPPKSKKPNKAE
jgi:hypothetical protein